MQPLPKHTWIIRSADEDDVRRIAEALAIKLRAGDVVTLTGELGAGKTTLARAFIRAVLGEPDAEVPSPTFSLVQTYTHPRFAVAHADLYRVSDEAEVLELGLDDAAAAGVILVEWPERAPALLKRENAIEIRIDECAAPERRAITIEATGDAAKRLERAEAIWTFLSARREWRPARVTYLQGDASVRAYARLQGGPCPAILMDWPEQPDGPPVRDGLSYSRIAHLAEGTRAFDAIASLLIDAGLRAPRILDRDHAQGVLLIDDLGDRVFGSEVAEGAPLEPLWRAATLTLVELRHMTSDRIATWNARRDAIWRIPPMDLQTLAIETELLIDWYWPLVWGMQIPDAVRAAFGEAWMPVFRRVTSELQGLALRDYHSPNLLWLSDAPPATGSDVDRAVKSVGIIDFQDALIAHPAYDLVSLLQDARLDVPSDVETRLLDLYVRSVREREPAFDDAAFRAAYAALGAQRNTKILGIFARLNVRDGKPQYLRHIPRLWRYLERDLAHPGLEGVKAWFDENLPARSRVLAS
ncbi:MAG: tRNA (adenosine(37)-N6)-threonylcarbamoyltransferase complex ATPase subunit type 1 TsaE [Hyphomicrobium sp.]|nr:tRNA (adenosine(37)-N6)-threonylcarbamoyltransferase complex ATPase subunit type 1 TsaE [Hyphomicrobium sp.]